MHTAKRVSPLEAVNEIRNDNGGQVVLVLQGGGALGAYQGGVYEALHEAGVEPDWIVGTSIGAINASIIAGNDEPLAAAQGILEARRSARLLGRISRLGGRGRSLVVMDDSRQRHLGILRAAKRCLYGAHMRPLGPDNAGYYSTAPLRGTLDLVDFDFLDPQQSAPHGGCGSCPDERDALFRFARHAVDRRACDGVGRATAGVPCRAGRR